MRKGILLFVLSTGLAVSGYLQEAQVEFSNYQEMRAAVGKLYQEKKYQEAADILEKALSRFPDRIKANTYNLALMQAHLGKSEKAAESLLYAIDKGIWFGKYDFQQAVWAPLRESDAFKAFQARNEAMRQEALKSAKPELLVVTPEGYTPDKKYPLFLALHGGGENIAGFKENWKSEKMKKEFIVAYPQSSLLIGMDSFNWTEDLEISKKEIADAYRNIVGKYAVDTQRVIIGGFSSGGVAGLEVLLNEVVPAEGFIVLCPAKPESFTSEKVKKAREQGVSGTLLTTEMDDRVDQQKAMDEIMKAEGMPHQFFITPNVGHWYPDDLGRRIDEAVEFIRNNRKK